jgi:hypothetical protein
LAEALHRARCVLHPGREAAGRCTSCERFYCRECVTSHEGRLRCARCLEIAAGAAPDGSKRWGSVRAVARLACGVLAAWLFFLVVGELLVAIPKGTIEGPALESE